MTPDTTQVRLALRRAAGRTSADERVDLGRRLLRYHGRDAFLRGMRDFVRYGGELTPAQQRKAERHLAAPTEPTEPAR